MQLWVARVLGGGRRAPFHGDVERREERKAFKHLRRFVFAKRTLPLMILPAPPNTTVILDPLSRQS